MCVFFFSGGGREEKRKQGETGDAIESFQGLLTFIASFDSVFSCLLFLHQIASWSRLSLYRDELSSLSVI